MTAPNGTPGPFSDAARPLRPLPAPIFASRWLQLPLYLGLIAAQCVYVWHFLVELTHLVEAAFGSDTAISYIERIINPAHYERHRFPHLLRERVVHE